MGRFLLLIEGVAPGIYVLAVLGVIWGLRSLMLARAELTVAQFRLERENAEELGGRGISLVIISIQIAILIWLIANTVTQAWDNLAVNDEPVVEAPRQFETSVPVESGSGVEAPTPIPDGPDIVRTQPPSPTAAGTLRPAESAAGCIYDQAFIEIPDSGQVIFQATSIQGTANITDFARYRFEIKNVDTGGEFGVIGGAESDYTEPIVDGPLGQIIPQNFLPGEYRFRLVVFDTGGMARAMCEITIFISEPLPTPTPIGGGAPQPLIPGPTLAPTPGQ